MTFFEPVMVNPSWIKGFLVVPGGLGGCAIGRVGEEVCWLSGPFSMREREKDGGRPERGACSKGARERGAWRMWLRRE